MSKNDGSLKREIIRLYREEHLTLLEIRDLLDKDERYIWEILKHEPEMLVVFDKNELKRKYKKKVKEVTQLKIIADLQTTKSNLFRFVQEDKVGRVTFMKKTLNYLEVPYTIEFGERPAKVKEITNHYKEFSYDKDFKEKGDLSEMKLNQEMIDKSKETIKSIMLGKNLPIELISRILDQTDIIARESCIFGIQAERMGRGKTLHESIIKKRNEL